VNCLYAFNYMNMMLSLVTNCDLAIPLYTLFSSNYPTVLDACSYSLIHDMEDLNWR
jgi:hypothetical protein